MPGNHAPDFFNTQLPRLELTARVYSLGVHVLRLIPEHPAPRGGSSPPLALCSHGDSAFVRW